MEKLREAKQKFLSEEIIGKGFDGEAFTLFCEGIKGTEIDEYSLEDLKKIVKDFQTTAEELKANTDPVLQSEIDSEISVPESKVESLPVKSEPSKPFPIRQNDSAAYSIEAVKMQDNDLSLEEVITVILGPVESVVGGILSTTKLYYPIETKPFGCVVRRSVEDFLWIRQILGINFPGVYLPPNPPKRYKNTTEDYLKQQYFLERFINCIVRNPLLRRCSYLQSFLMENDNRIYADVKKRSSKEKKITRLEEFWTLDGTLICDPFYDETEKSTINEYVNVVESMKKKLKRQSDSVILTFKELSNQILELGKSFEILENVQNFVPEITGTKPLYHSLKICMINWAEHEHKCADLLKDQFSMFFKYGYTETQPIKELLREKDLKMDLYEKAKLRLLAKKEKLWSAADVNKWGLSNEDMWNASVLKSDKALAFGKMLRKETLDIEKMKDEFAYLNFQTKSEIRRFLLDNQLIENLHFTLFARSMCTQTTDIHVNWGELIASLSRIRSENIPSRSFISKNSNKS